MNYTGGHCRTPCAETEQEPSDFGLEDYEQGYHADSQKLSEYERKQLHLEQPRDNPDDVYSYYTAEYLRRVGPSHQFDYPVNKARNEGDVKNVDERYIYKIEHNRANI